MEDHALGFYQALIEARIPFEMVHDRLLDAEHLARFRTSDPAQHRRALRRAVRADSAHSLRSGGGIVATHETSLYDEWGVHRADFGLPICSAHRSPAKLEARMLNSYLQPGKGSREQARIIRCWRIGRRRPHHQRREPG